MEDRSSANDDSAKEQQMTSEEGAAVEEEPTEVAVESTMTSAKKDAGLSVEKWNTKAQQQIESMGDLLMILKDTTLDPAFKYEIDKELKQLYSKEDTVFENLGLNDVLFTDFESLKHENGDTLSLKFKNDTVNLKAKFTIVSEAKDFGGTIEMIEQLKIISVEKY